VAIKLADAIAYLDLDHSGLDRGMQQAEQRTERGAAGIGKKLALGIAGAVAAGGSAIAGGVAAAFKLAVGAAPVADLQMAFEGFTQNVAGGADAMLAAMQDATGGMVPFRDLMRSFNTANQLVGEDFAQRLPEAMQYLGKVSAATGQDMSYLLDSLVTGVGRQSKMILDILGITVDAVAANEAYA